MLRNRGNRRHYRDVEEPTVDRLAQRVLGTGRRFIGRSLSRNNFSRIDGCPDHGLTILAYVSAHLLDFLRPTVNLIQNRTGLVGITNGATFRSFSDIVNDLVITICRLRIRSVVIVNRSSYNVLGAATSDLYHRVTRRNISSTTVTTIQPGLRR